MITTAALQPACFLDRDGTLNVDHDFVHRPDEWDWIPGVPDALLRLQRAGYKLIVVTNQSGIARGRFSMEDVEALHAYAARQLAESGVHISGWYIAPWHPDFHNGKDPALLAERKPGTGLFERAALEHQLDLSRSFMVGDKASDLKPALKLGIRPFLVRSRFYSEELERWCASQNIAIADDLPQLLQREPELLHP
ncbi:D-alpha,beta-D-heptose 1,7-bisphosphate phosphatase [Cyclonatronum proteinivorum]|uniref:D,D-heptose 1,7-bisphosphate phosphatase n=1 Tax=Cyclonatronum proteinivorum TaxID=1457365 RepID=A0A345UGC5_9BACT|nr:HAD family hydrolase [Cyclonatronum proteinivorum]AXI99526.1 D-alpha,beta-D-heptose 1,7-bisphosphate phosphatase [Cyclonatronum proteinivorum]